MTVASGRRPDAGALVPQQQGNGLELRAYSRRHAAVPGSHLNLTDGSGEHRDDVAAGADASLLPGGGTASARLALAWSSQRLLLWNTGHGGRGSMPHSPADGTRNVPSRGPGLRTPSRLADLRGSTQRASNRPLTRTPEPPVVGCWPRHGKVVAGRPVRFSGASLILTRARAHNSRPVARSTGDGQGR